MRTEAVVPEAVLQAVRAPFLAMGATILDAPVLLPLGLLLDVTGEALRERLFVVSSEVGEEACLRPDFTVPALLAHSAGGEREGRYFYEGRAFRVAPPGSDRAEEFLQIGLEAFGAGDAPEVDGEIAALAWRAAAAGGRHDLCLVLGDAGLFATFVDALEIGGAKAVRLKRSFASPRRLAAELDTSETAERRGAGASGLARLLAGLPEAEATSVLEEIWLLAGIEPVGGRPPADIVRRLTQRADAAAEAPLDTRRADLMRRFLAVAEEPRAALAAIGELAGENRPALEDSLARWDRRLAALAKNGVPPGAVTFSAALGRAFGYYDGALFEVRSAALGPDQAVAAGGRYDGLAVRLGAPAGGALGCMVRPGRAWSGGRP
jgi:ATP phosphoribosyltransferase regulatory subunit